MCVDCDLRYFRPFFGTRGIPCFAGCRRGTSLKVRRLSPSYHFLYSLFSSRFCGGLTDDLPLPKILFFQDPVIRVSFKEFSLHFREVLFFFFGILRPPPGTLVFLNQGSRNCPARAGPQPAGDPFRHWSSFCLCLYLRTMGDLDWSL